MLKEGYQKVARLSSCGPLYRTDDAPFIDKTRSIQNRQFSEMDGAGRRI
jgi:hypothetical protein